MVHVPRDAERRRLLLRPRRMYEVDPEIMVSPYIVNSPFASDLLYSEEYRLELSRAFSEVYLLRGGSAVTSVMYHQPLRVFRDPAKIQKATLSCNGQDPVVAHLNPLLQQLGQHPL
jgi:hypothetical protein